MRITLAAVPRTARQLRNPLSGREMRELRRHPREIAQSPFVFVSERGAPLSAPGFSRIIERAATARAVTSSPTMAMTRVRSKPISGIAIFRIRRAIRRWRLTDLRNSFWIDQGVPPIKRGVQLRKQYYFDRLRPGNSPYDLPIQLSRKNQRSSPARHFLRASARHAFSFGLFWRHLASRSLQRPLLGAAFEWAGMLALPSFWAFGCDIGAMPSNKIDVATITIADRTISDLSFELRPAWRFAAELLPLPPPFIRSHRTASTGCKMKDPASYKPSRLP